MIKEYVYKKLVKILDDQKYMESDRPTISCIVTNSKGWVIGEGSNNYTKTHPKQKFYADKVHNKYSIYLHAEIAALVKCRDFPYAIYILRLLKNGKFGLARPCPICELAIREAGIKKVFYSSYEGFCYYEPV